jgi:hypothetical protein
MVLREGAETVLMLSAVSLNSTELMSFLGTLLGVMAAIAFGVMFVKGSVRINLQKVLQGYDGDPVSGGGAAGDYRAARAFGKRRDSVVEAVRWRSLVRSSATTGSSL